MSHIPAETSDRRSRHASSRDSEIIARRLSTGTAVNRRHASVQKMATHAQKDKEKENLGNPVLGQEPRRDPDDARRAGLSGLAGGDIDAGRRMSTYVGRCITRSLARSIVVTRVTRTQLCARETGKSRGPRETASRWFEPTSQHRRGRRRRDERAARHVRPARVTGAIPIPRAPRRGCRRRASDDARRRLPVHHHRKPAHEAALRAFAGSRAGGATLPAEAPGLAATTPRTPTKLAKSPARRRVLSDLYGRLTVATEREPSGEDVASTEQGTDATGETGVSAGRRGGLRAAEGGVSPSEEVRRTAEGDPAPHARLGGQARRGLRRAPLHTLQPLVGQEVARASLNGQSV